MVCYEVWINGRRACVAGIGNLGVLSALVTWVKRERWGDDEPCTSEGLVESLHMRVGGLMHHGKDTVYLDWITDQPLSVGDELQIKIIDLDKCDPQLPAKLIAQSSSSANAGSVIRR